MRPGNQGGVRKEATRRAFTHSSCRTTGAPLTNMAEYLAAEVIEEHGLATPLTWIEHYPEHEGGIGEYSLGEFSCWECEEVCLGGVWRYRVEPPKWSSLRLQEVGVLIGGLDEQLTTLLLPRRSPLDHPKTSAQPRVMGRS